MLHRAHWLSLINPPQAGNQVAEPPRWINRSPSYAEPAGRPAQDGPMGLKRKDVYMRAPFVMGPPDDILVFASLKGFQSYVEPWFRDSFDPPVYDSEGRLFRIVFDESGKSPTGNTLAPLEENPSHADDARRLLIEYLQRQKKPPQRLQDQTLDELFALALPSAVDVYRGRK